MFKRFIDLEAAIIPETPNIFRILAIFDANQFAKTIYWTQNFASWKLIIYLTGTEKFY